MAETTSVPVKAGNGQLRRAEPSGWLSDIEAEMERFWRGPWSFWSMPMMRPSRMGAWTPRMDVYEKDNTIVFKTELPGLKKEDVQVEIEGGDLVIRGESKAETEINEEDYVRSERTFGSFYRRTPLPAGVKPHEIEATLKEGMLEVRVPRPGETKPEPQKIAVK